MVALVIIPGQSHHCISNSQRAESRKGEMAKRYCLETVLIPLDAFLSNLCSLGRLFLCSFSDI